MQYSGGPRPPGETRNILIAFALSALILFGWEFFYARPQQQRLQAERARVEAQTPLPAPQPPPVAPEQAEAQTAGQRIPIATQTLSGSILLTGARFDALDLRAYPRTVARNSPPVTLLAPIDANEGHDALLGWEQQTGQTSAVVASASSVWRAPPGAQLTPTTPLVLTLSGPNGITIERTISVDRDYMFTSTDRIINSGNTAAVLRPRGVVRERGLPPDYRRNQIVHQGMIGAYGASNHMHNTRFEDAAKPAGQQLGRIVRLEDEHGTGGWLGITDHYWLAAIVLDPRERMHAWYEALDASGATPLEQATSYSAHYEGDWRTVPAHGEITYTQHFFAGPKLVDLLQRYQHDLQIPTFDKAVDWGGLEFLTRTFFSVLLHPLARLAQGFAGPYAFALGILMTTIVIRALFFPLMYHSFKQMAKMRGLAPKMKEIQERFASDPQRMQQEVMKLYKVEKANPLSGCAPMLVQIPVFYALYKTLSVTIEMRHAPFFGWVRDLSAPDPVTVFNLFGLLPYDPHTVPFIGGILGIGLWPIIYGFAMWGLQSLSPPPPDPSQAQIMRWMPWVFAFMLGGLPAGLLIYYSWSNLLLIGQQYVIMRRQGQHTQLDLFLEKRLRKRKPDEEKPPDEKK